MPQLLSNELHFTEPWLLLIRNVMFVMIYDFTVGYTCGSVLNFQDDVKWNRLGKLIWSWTAYIHRKLKIIITLVNDKWSLLKIFCGLRKKNSFWYEPWEPLYLGPGVVHIKNYITSIWLCNLIYCLLSQKTAGKRWQRHTKVDLNKMWSSWEKAGEKEDM